MMTVLKTSLLLLLLCCAVQLTSAGPLADDVAKSICCFNVNNLRIPKKQLDSYFWTSSSCPLRHIVFVTVRKRRFCMNPENIWAKLNLNHIGKKMASNSPK
ncbi:hypothetical protein R3I93_022690 [Phoxinus phoxinus]|uniref:Chemokine interleukin-8-like domain-containing protein n=1 Tax=Phoxinus phoxinus TaxID=58324 RepID=A0AAN9CAH1_9TELE